MITLSKWIDKHTKLPIIRLIIMGIGIQLLYFSYLTYNRFSTQLERIEQARETISIGVQQSNRPLIESDMTSLFGNSEVAVVALCSGSVANISYPPLGKDYCFHTVRNFKRWPIRKPLIGLQDLDLVVVLCPVIVFGPLLFLIFITLIMVTGVIWTMSRMRKRLDAEVLDPLCEGLNAESPLNISELEELRRKNLEYIDLVRKLAVSKAMSDLSAQVAHDIRSPLAALESITKDIAQLPEEKRIIIRSAMGRIRDIANNLIEKNRQLPKDSFSKDAIMSTSVEPLNNYLLSSLIDPVITEKHFQFRSKSDIEIIAQLDKASYGLFAKFHDIDYTS